MRDILCHAATFSLHLLQMLCRLKSCPPEHKTSSTSTYRELGEQAIMPPF